MNAEEHPSFDYAAKAEKIRGEAANSSIREAILHHLREAAASLPGQRFRDGRTAEESMERLIEGMNLMVTDDYLPERSLRETLKQVIYERHLDGDQARQYVALVGILLEEMEGSSEWSEPGQALDAMEKRLSARICLYDDLPLTEQIDRLAACAWPELEPQTTRLCYLRLLQDIVDPLTPAQRSDSLRRMAELCADRENALIVAALNYEETVTGDVPFASRLDPASFTLAAACSLSATRACALELSGRITQTDAEELISSAQAQCCGWTAALIGSALFVSGVAATNALAEYALAESVSVLAGLLIYPVGYGLAVAGLMLMIAYGIPHFMQWTAAVNASRYVRRLSREAKASGNSAEAERLLLLSESADWEETGAEERPALADGECW